jgi:hypothetical protein
MHLDLATVLLQWSTGGLLFLWVTTRRREVSLGYGWLLRGVYAGMAMGALVAGRALDQDRMGAQVRDLSSLLVVLTALAVLWVSVQRKAAGVSGHEEVRARRKERVRAMVSPSTAAEPPLDAAATGREFPPALDLIAPAIGLIGVLGAAGPAGGPYALTAFRLLSGVLLMGAATDAMLLGHWYLTQPGLSRDPLRELVRWCAIAWPLDVIAFMIPTGILQVFTGTVDDGYNGLLAWVWLAFALTTLGLVIFAGLALRERSYSAVMAVTGLLYLAILTAFVMDLVPRAVLSS